MGGLRVWVLFLLLLWGENISLCYGAGKGKKEEKGGVPGVIYKGVDVSRYQEKINWGKVKDEGIVFAYAKASEGNSIQDRTFQENVQNARREGIKISAYHFFRFHTPASQQMKCFSNAIDMKNMDMVPALDIEEDIGNRHRGNIEKVRKNIRAFLKEFERRYHIKMVIYTNETCYKRYIKGYFDDYPLWICSIQGEVDFVDKYHFWQYSHRGRVKGIQGSVDMNYFTGNYFDWLNITFCRDKEEQIARTPLLKIGIKYSFIPTRIKRRIKLVSQECKLSIKGRKIEGATD